MLSVQLGVFEAIDLVKSCDPRLALDWPLKATILRFYIKKISGYASSERWKSNGVETSNA